MLDLMMRKKKKEAQSGNGMNGQKNGRTSEDNRNPHYREYDDLVAGREIDRSGRRPSCAGFILDCSVARVGSGCGILGSG